MIPAVLSIAGSDASGGAGIQADIKTIASHKLYAETVITALTAQNTTGVAGVLPIEPAFIRAQMDSVFADIRPDAVKIGMVPTSDAAQAIADGLVAADAEHVVLDPVMVATSGATLADSPAVAGIVAHLLPLAEIVTPNIPEAQVLAGREIATREDREEAARAIQGKMRAGAWVLVKGGHASDTADDLLLTEHGRCVWLPHKLIDTPNTHGTGCTLSSAIACGLAAGFDVQASVSKAKQYVTGALECDLGMGRGAGPIDHMWQYR